MIVQLERDFPPTCLPRLIVSGDECPLMDIAGSDTKVTGNTEPFAHLIGGSLEAVGNAEWDFD